VGQEITDQPSQSRELTRDPALPLTNAAEETYAFERALGYGMREATRRAGGKPENGTGTKWENKPHVQARIKHLRGLDEEMLREKRRRIEERLSLSAFMDIFEFAKVGADGETITIDWNSVKDSPLAVVISEFRFDKESGELISFKRDDALAALAQLRDMHGFKAPARTELTGKDGEALSLAALVGASMKVKTEAA